MAFNQFNNILVTSPQGVQAPATQIVWAGEGDVLIYNSDSVNPVFLSDSNGLLSADQSGVSVLGPLSSLVFNGDIDVYAGSAPGVTVILRAYPSATQFTNVTTVTPLGSVGGISGPVTNFIPGNTSFSFQPNSISPYFNVGMFASYDFSAYFFSATPTAFSSTLITLQWFDDNTSGIPVFEENWWIYNGRAAFTAPTNPPVTAMAACGPMHGQFMTVTFTNVDTAQTSIQWANLFGSNRNPPYSDWRQNAAIVNPIFPGFTVSLPTWGVGFDNILGGFSITIPVSSTRVIPLGLYSGPVYLRYSQNAIGAATTVIAIANGQPVLTGLSNTTILTGVNDTNEHEFNFQAPRAPMYLIAQTTGAAAMGLTGQIIGQQAA